jgi:hypothetical protein
LRKKGVFFLNKFIFIEVFFLPHLLWPSLFACKVFAHLICSIRLREEYKICGFASFFPIKKFFFFLYIKLQSKIREMHEKNKKKLFFSLFSNFLTLTQHHRIHPSKVSKNRNFSLSE